MIWYPYVQMKKMKTPYKIVDAEGVYLYTQDNKMIDSVSSWWCMIHGYKNKEINEAMKNQIDQFSLSFTIKGARPRDGSSRISTLGFAISPLAMASICCSPPDMVPAR